MLAFRSLDPFRALREPDRRRRDEERLSRSEQRTLSKTQNNHLTGKAPYKFESTLLQRRVISEPRERSPSFNPGQTATAMITTSARSHGRQISRPPRPFRAQPRRWRGGGSHAVTRQPDQPGHRRRARGGAGMAEPAARPGLSGDLL